MTPDPEKNKKWILSSKCEKNFMNNQKKTNQSPGNAKSFDSRTKASISSQNPASSMAQKDAGPHKKSLNFKNSLLVITALCVVIAGVTIWAMRSASTQSKKEGLAYLNTQASKNLDDVQNKLNERKAAEQQAQIDQEIDNINSDAASIWPMFDNSVILGDSRAEGFKSFDFLPDSIVLAEIGAQIKRIPEFAETIGTRKPEVIYLCYGLNDVLSNVGMENGPDGYGQLYESYIKQLLEKSPNSKIVVCSIIPASPSAIAANPGYEKTADFDRQVKEMCERNGWTYVDANSLVSDPSVYEPDGEHFVRSAYDEWGKMLLKSQYPSLN